MTPLPTPDLPRPRRRMRRAAVATLVSLALAAQPIAPATFAVGAAQAQALPDLGEESQAALTAGQERRIGESIIRQIRASGGYLEDPEVNDYLNELGHRLVAAVPESRQDFEFFAMADPSINAFALPGGYVGVNTGLILLTQSESELASVLAHEITHVTQRHMARSVAGQQRGFMYMLAALAVAIAASRSNSSSSAPGDVRRDRFGAGARDPDADQLHPRTRIRGRSHRVPAPRRRRLRRQRDGDAHGPAAEIEPVRRWRRAVLSALSPDHLRARSPRRSRAPTARPTGR